MTRKIGAVDINPVSGSAKSSPCVIQLVPLTGINKCIYAGPSQALACNDHYHTGPIFRITSVSSICGHHLFLFFFACVTMELWAPVPQPGMEPGPTAVKVLSFSCRTIREVLLFILVSFILHSKFMVCLQKIMSSYLLCAVDGLEVYCLDSHNY